MKNRMRELRSFGSVRGEGGNVLAYSEDSGKHPGIPVPAVTGMPGCLHLFRGMFVSGLGSLDIKQRRLRVWQRSANSRHYSVRCTFCKADAAVSENPVGCPIGREGTILGVRRSVAELPLRRK